MSPLALALVVMAGAPNLRDKPSADLCGEWEAEAPPGAEGPVVRYLFHPDGTYQVFLDGRDLGGARGYTFDPKLRPAEIDLNAPPAGQTDPLAVGIYKVEGDRLTLVLAVPGHGRPDRFDAPAAEATRTYLRRVKPKG